MGTTDSILVIQFAIILVLLFFFFYIIRFNISLKLSRRISKYSIDALSDDQTSLFDALYILYKKIIEELSKSLINIKTVENYSHKYDPYIDYLDDKKPIDFVSTKVFVSFIFLLITLLANVLEFSYPGLFEIVFTMGIGYLLPDIYNQYQNYTRKKRIERDLLNAIIMLNNAFKSGRSTMQAIEIVKNELDGPISEEFAKMHREISYGLSLESVFQRFADRVNIEEVSYITSSLTILNRTGGNIVKVFSSIERSLFSKRKLESELRALTSSSRTMSKILLFLPFAFVGIIVLLNPTYFNSFFDNFIGLTIFFTLVMFYVLYAFLVQKVMKVRM